MKVSEEGIYYTSVTMKLRQWSSLRELILAKLDARYQIYILLNRQSFFSSLLNLMTEVESCFRKVIL
jgi:hypothetical protein